MHDYVNMRVYWENGHPSAILENSRARLEPARWPRTLSVPAPVNDVDDVFMTEVLRALRQRRATERFQILSQ